MGGWELGIAVVVVALVVLVAAIGVGLGIGLTLFVLKRRTPVPPEEVSASKAVAKPPIERPAPPQKAYPPGAPSRGGKLSFFDDDADDATTVHVRGAMKRPAESEDTDDHTELFSKADLASFDDAAAVLEDDSSPRPVRR